METERSHSIPERPHTEDAAHQALWVRSWIFDLDHRVRTAESPGRHTVNPGACGLEYMIPTIVPSPNSDLGQVLRSECGRLSLDITPLLPHSDSSPPMTKTNVWKACEHSILTLVSMWKSCKISQKKENWQLSLPKCLWLEKSGWCKYRWGAGRVLNDCHPLWPYR